MNTLFACAGSGNCFKPWLAMVQLGIPFQLRMIDVLGGEQKSSEYLRINPLGVVPYLRTASGQGIGESNAMLWYLADGTDLMPRRAEGRAEALQWMFFEQSRLEPFISPARFFTTILPGERAARAAYIADCQSKAGPGLARLEAHLADRRFMLGEGYSVADIALFGYVHVLEDAGLRMADYPAVAAWVQAVSETPGFRPLNEMEPDAARAA